MWCRDNDVAVTIVSDGLGALHRADAGGGGHPDVAVITNDWARRRDGVPERASGVHLVRHLQDAGGPARGRARSRSSARDIPTVTARCTPTSSFAKDELVRSVSRRRRAVRPLRGLRRRARALADRPTICRARWRRTLARAGNGMNLPQGLTRPTLTVDDVDDDDRDGQHVRAHDSGELMWERADLLSDISGDGFDPTRTGSASSTATGSSPGRSCRGRAGLWIDVHPTRADAGSERRSAGGPWIGPGARQ